jgi:two-component system, NarL family, response regulator NreC
MLRVFLADDHDELRAGLRAMIDGEPDMHVVGEAPDGLTAETGIVRTRADVAVIDISMPGRDGLKTTAALRETSPTTRVLVFSVHEDPDLVRAAIAAGAAGYVEKHIADVALVAAIRAVARGRALVDVSSRGALAQQLGDTPAPARAPTELAGLSVRERQVLERVAQGHTNREVSEQLGLSIKSVETYRARSMCKLGLGTRAELVRFALRHGMLAPD